MTIPPKIHKRRDANYSVGILQWCSFGSISKNNWKDLRFLCFAIHMFNLFTALPNSATFSRAKRKNPASRRLSLSSAYRSWRGVLTSLLISRYVTDYWTARVRKQ